MRRDDDGRGGQDRVDHSSLTSPRVLSAMAALVEAMRRVDQDPGSTARAEAAIRARLALAEALTDLGWAAPASTGAARSRDRLVVDLGLDRFERLRLLPPPRQPSG